MIRWGILGAARIARRRVIPAIQSSVNGRVRAIASRDPERAWTIAAHFGLPVVHPTYAALLADPTIDAVYLPLPNSEHVTWTIAAAAAGKHILCEKPLALTAAEAEAMVRAAADAGVVLAEALAYRFHPRIAHVLRLVHTGTIGDLHVLRFAFTAGPPASGDIRLDAALGGGVLLDLGCYGVNLARLTCQSEPEVITGLAHWGASGVDETFAGLLRFPHATLVSLDVSLASQFSVSFELIGATGRIVVPMGVRPETNQPTAVQVDHGDTEEVITISAADPYRLMVEDFADAIEAQRPVQFGPTDAVANMRVLDGLRAAALAHQGRW